MDSRIRPLRRGEFRYKLTIDDVTLEHMSSHTVENIYGRQERIAFTTELPIKTTYINYFGFKVTNKRDPFLKELVEDLMFFNQGIDTLGAKKMIEFIINKAVKRYNGDPCLKFEDIEDTVKAYIEASIGTQHKLLTDVVVLFEKSTMLTPEERRAISLEARHIRSSMLNGALIHNAAITAIDTITGKLKITRPRVLDKVVDNKIKTVRTLNKHIREDTVDLLEKANFNRHFTTEASEKKYRLFLDLPKDFSHAQIASSLNISRSTVIQFKQIEQWEN